jgi:hypothetical protein
MAGLALISTILNSKGWAELGLFEPPWWQEAPRWPRGWEWASFVMFTAALIAAVSSGPKSESCPGPLAFMCNEPDRSMIATVK